MARTPLSPPSPCRKHRPFGYWRLRASAPSSPPTRTAFSSPHIHAPLSSSSGVSSTTTRKSAHQPRVPATMSLSDSRPYFTRHRQQAKTKILMVSEDRWRGHTTRRSQTATVPVEASSGQGGVSSGTEPLTTHLPICHPSHGTLEWQRPAFYRLSTAQWPQDAPKAHAHAADTPVPREE